jgi:hypothetical protein
MVRPLACLTRLCCGVLLINRAFNSSILFHKSLIYGFYLVALLFEQV